jgi:hypothetical protein
MKINKILLVLFAALLIGCTAEEVPKKNMYECCNRVVSISSQPLPGSGSSALGSYVTKNDCDGSYQRSNYSETFPCPKIGDCE